MIIYYLLLVGSVVASVQGAARNCGPNPSRIYLKRGDKRSVEYWVPPPEDQPPPLQSRNDDGEQEQDATSDAPSTGGLTTWRMDDGDSGDWTTMTSRTDELNEAESDGESPAGSTGLKVRDDDDVTTILPDDATAADGVNDQEAQPNTDGTSQQGTEFKIDVVTHSPVDVASDVTEFSIAQREEIVLKSDGSGEGSGDTTPATFIRLDQSLPEEINMDPIVTEPTADSKAEMLENLMMQEELRPHTAVKSSTTTAESVTIENEEFDHPTSQSPAGMAEQPVTQEPVVSTDSVQIEIAKVKTEESVSSQLKDDLEQDITHILMEVPVLPQSEDQVREEGESQANTEEPETVTIVDFKNELGEAVDIHSEEIAESVTEVEDIVKSVFEEPKVAVDIVQPEELKIAEDSVQPEETIVIQSLTDKTVVASDASEFQLGGSGFDSVDALLPTVVHDNDEPEFKVEGSGDVPTILTSDDVAALAFEGSGSDPVEIQIGQSDALEGSGSPVVDRMDGPESRDVIASVEDESPPEFRNDDILINRIRTIVNSLTNPRETSSILFRRTSGLLQSVFKRTKRQSEQQFDPSDLVRSPEFLRFLRTQPLPLRRALSPNFYGRFSRQMHPESDVEISREEEGEECDLQIKTDPGLHLLLTFHNLSAPYTVDCAGAYVEIEREGNGFEARWCGNPIGQQRGVRSHVIFARSEVRVSVYSNKNTLLKNQIHSGEDNNSLDPQLPIDESIPPTGFSADIEVIDLHDAGQFTSFQRSEAYSSVHRRIG